MLRFPGIFKKAEPTPSPDKLVREAIDMGVQAREFMASHLFRVICEQAEGKVIAAQNALSKVDPTDVEEIIRLQGTVKQFDHFLSTLSEMVLTGDSALQLMQPGQE